jgi:hypothetical protein
VHHFGNIDLASPRFLSRYYRLWFLAGLDSDRLLHRQQLAGVGYSCAAGRQVDAVDHLFGSAVMDHMASSFERKQSGLCQDFVQPPGLTREVDEPISCPAIMIIGILSSLYRFISLCERNGRGRHRNCIFSACLELIMRWPQRQLGRKFGLETRRYRSRRKKLFEHPRSHGASKQWRDRVAQQIANNGSRAWPRCEHISAKSREIVTREKDQASNDRRVSIARESATKVAHECPTTIACSMSR